MLPTIGTSRLVLGPVEKKISAITGTTVRIESVRFGWITAFSLRKLELGPTRDGEPSLLVMEDVRVPLSILKGATLPPYDLEGITVERLHVRSIRRADGSSNWQELLQQVQANMPPPATESVPVVEAPPASGEFPPAVLRTLLEKLSLEVKDLTILHEDAALPEPLSIGIADASITAVFPAADGSLEIIARTPLRVNQVTEIITTELRIHGVLAPTPMQGAPPIHVLARADSLAVGGRLDFAMRDPQHIIANGDWRLTLEPILALAQSAAPAATDGIALAGELTGSFTAKGNPQGALTVTLDHRGSSLTLEHPALAHPLQLPATTANLRTEFNTTGQSVESLSLSYDLAALRGTVEARHLGAPPLSPGFHLEAKTSVDIAAGAAIAASMLDPAAAAPLSGTRLESRIIVSADGDGLAGSLSLQLIGGVLHSLAPFAENPPLLNEGPLSLSAADLSLEAPIRANLQSGIIELDQLLWQFGDWMHGGLSLQANIADPAAPELALQLWHEVLLDHLGAVLGEVGVELPATITGTARLEVQGAGAPLGTMTTQVDFTLDDCTVVLPDQPLLIEGEALRFTTIIKSDAPAAQLYIRELCLEHATLQVTATGEASAGRGATIHMETRISLPAVLDYAYRVAPDLELLLDGAIIARASIIADPAGVLQVSAAAESAEAFLETPITGAMPLPFYGAVELFLDGTGEAPVVFVDAVQGAFASTVFLDGSATFHHGRMFDMQSRAWLDVESLLPMVPPSILENVGATIESHGLAEATIVLSVLLPENDSERPEVHAEVIAIAEIPDLLWTFGEELNGEIGGVAARGAIHAMVPRDPAESPMFSVEGTSAIATVSGPAGIALRGFAASASVSGLPENLKIAASSTLEELQHTSEAATVVIPSIGGSVDITVNLPEENLQVHSASASIADVLSASATLAVRGWSEPTTGTITLDTAMEMTDIGAPLRWVTFAAPMPLPELSGALTQDFALRGPLDPRPFLLRGTVPYEGSASGSLRDGAVSMPEVAMVPELSAQWSASANADSITAEITASTGAITGPSIPLSIGPLRLSASTALDQLDRLRLTLTDLGSAVPQADATGEIVVSGIAPVLREAISAGIEQRTANLPATPEEWLRVLRVTMDGGAEVTLDDLTGLVPDLALTGRIAGVARMDTASDQLRFSVEGTPTAVGVRFADLFSMVGADGPLRLQKTISLSSSAPALRRPELRSMRIAGITVTKQPFAVRIGNLTINVSGLDGGIEVEGRTPDFAGGTARARAALRLVEGVPVLTAEAHCTAMDTRTLSTAFAGEGRSAGTIDAFLRLRWELRPDLSGMLDGMDFSLQVPTIHPRALMEFIRILDPKGAHPGMQAGRLALNFGAPRAMSFKLRNGLTSLSLEVAPAIGPAVPLTLLERVPIGDLTGVVDTDSLGPVVRRANAALLMLLAPDLTTMLQQIEPILAEPTP